MLTGKDLGAAIAEAIRLKGGNRSEVARHFGVKPESTYDWTKHGRISKKHLERMVAYFADVVPPSHWGLTGGSLASQPVQLTAEIILAAYREAVRKYETTGLNATSFQPLADPDHAALLASAIEAQLSGPSDSAGSETVEVGRGARRKGEERGGATSEDRQAEAGGESRPSARQRKKRAA